MSIVIAQLSVLYFQFVWNLGFHVLIGHLPAYATRLDAEILFLQQPDIVPRQ